MEGAAQSLVSNIEQLVGDEFRQLRGVGSEVARSRNELATINALLRMQSEADECTVNHFVREWMKQLREVGYDAEDCIHLYLFRVKCHSGDRFLVWTKRLLTTLLSRHHLTGDIRDLRALASSINEHHARYGVSLESLLDHPTGPLQTVAASAVRALRPADDPDNHLVGIEAQVMDLADKVKQLNDESDSDKQLKVFSIVGFGGLGKTTLAVAVCRQLKTEFQRQAQESVSQTFSAKDLQGLLKRLLRQIAEQEVQQVHPLGNIDAMPVDELKRELEKRLSNKRYK